MDKQASIKHRLHQVIFGQHIHKDRWAAAFEIGLSTLILLNTLAIMLETIPGLYARWKTFFVAFEVFSVSLFTVEYAVRVWVADLSPDYQTTFGRLRYCLSPMALLDLAAIIPSLLLLSNLDLRVLRVLRLLRAFRLLRYSKYNQALHSLITAVRSKTPDLLMVAAIMFLLLIINSSLVYYAEHGAQPKAFSSIPMALWWGINSLTTIGYGDIYPITPLGRVIASFFAVLGIGFFALPSGMIASALIEQARAKDKQPSCPHCGRDLQE